MSPRPALPLRRALHLVFLLAAPAPSLLAAQLPEGARTASASAVSAPATTADARGPIPGRAINTPVPEPAPPRGARRPPGPPASALWPPGRATPRPCGRRRRLVCRVWGSD